MYTIRKIFRFEMSHQLVTSYTKACHETLHGHSYVLELFLSSKSLNEDDMVIDFTKVKDLIGDYINTWDHCLVMSSKHPKEYLDILVKYNKNVKIVDYNPTAERMSKDIYSVINNILTTNTPNINVVKVRLHETTTGYAEYKVTNIITDIFSD